MSKASLETQSYVAQKWFSSLKCMSKSSRNENHIIVRPNDLKRLNKYCFYSIHSCDRRAENWEFPKDF